MMVCTEALPNEREPTMVARLWSCHAPATISEAEAEPPLISTMSGLALVISLPRARKRCVASALRPRVDTISPRSKNDSDTVIAWSSKPPRLLRRSMMKPLSLSPAKAAGGLQSHVLKALGIHIAGLRIEPGQHPEDRPFDELIVVGLVDVVGAHALENNPEQAELPVRIPGRRACARSVQDEAGLH